MEQSRENGFSDSLTTERIVHFFASATETVADDSEMETALHDYLELGVVTDGAGIHLIDGQMICGAGGGGFLQVVLKRGVSKNDLKQRLYEVFKDSGVDVWDCELIKSF